MAEILIIDSMMGAMRKHTQRMLGEKAQSEEYFSSWKLDPFA